ncbi:type II toxin-antitoxin system Phd/YefM family antitoxin [uncultured Pyramidobacter sp.]|uniref:type II toxin-antitoxin system Phd/YefM family antitoxin n=1 Tax=uncultured Pyramidobacter sp. TaxID=1623495 RepID=UPI0028039936|nr:type II toxin-antitoxin system Phd/YefM family antitoxin [uncultured Pyramidobacter sp.]
MHYYLSLFIHSFLLTFLLLPHILQVKNTQGDDIMVYTADVLNSLVPITQFNRGQASRIFDRLHTENRLIVLKNNQPAAVILSPAEFGRLSEIEEDYALLMEAAERLAGNASVPTSSMSEVMSELGISDADLAEAGDVAIE